MSTWVCTRKAYALAVRYFFQRCEQRVLRAAKPAVKQHLAGTRGWLPSPRFRCCVAFGASARFVTATELISRVGLDSA